MLKFLNLYPKKVGLPPGTVVHVGEQKVERVGLRMIRYNAAEMEERKFYQLAECDWGFQEGRVQLLEISGLHDIETISELGRHFGLHGLVQEDIVNSTHRIKLEEYDSYLFLILKSIHYDREAKKLQTEHICLTLLSGGVLLFRESDDDTFRPIYERIRDQSKRLRSLGADYLAYALIDLVVDGYFVALEGLGADLELLDEEVTLAPTPETRNHIYFLRKTIMQMQRTIRPLREVLNFLEREEHPLIGPGMQIYFKDVYDHMLHVQDTFSTYFEILSGMLDTYFASLSNRMNEIMKVLTTIGTIFIPLTFIVGWYGMNFKHMPELELPWAYPGVLILSLLVTFGMVFYLLRKKWL